MRIVRRVFLATIVVLLFTGCVSLPQAFKDKDMQDSLNKSLHSYELTVRWGELSQIYSFLEPELAKTAQIQDNLQNIRATSYEVIKGPLGTSENQAMQSVRILYIYNDRQIQKTMIDHQEWTYNAEKREWRRSNPIPKF